MITFDKAILLNLIRGKLAVSDFEIGFFKIGKLLSEIDISEINDIYVIDPNIDGYNFENSNFTIKERLEKLNHLSGWVHLAGGLSFGIQDKRIKDFRLSKNYIEHCDHITREEIIDYNDIPDYELVDSMSWGLDISVDSYILVYNEKQLNFYIDPEKNTLKEIHSARLDKEKFTLR